MSVGLGEPPVNPLQDTQKVSLERESSVEGVEYPMQVRVSDYSGEDLLGLGDLQIKVYLRLSQTNWKMRLGGLGFGNNSHNRQKSRPRQTPLC